MAGEGLKLMVEELLHSLDDDEGGARDKKLSK